MKVIHNLKAILDNLNYGDTFSLTGDEIFIKTRHFNEDKEVLCVNIETGGSVYFGTFEEVIPVECSVSVRA